MSIGNNQDPPPDDVTAVYDRCLLHDPAGIRKHLKRLIEHRCLLIASADAGATSTVTALLAISDSSVWIDVPPGAEVLDRLLQCQRLSLEGAIDRITLRFSSGPPMLCSHDARPAIRVPMPERLLHLQRRELMRREPPAGLLECRVPPREPAGGAPATIASIRDIGGGGLAVLVTDGLLEVVAGDVLRGCVIELPEIGAVEVTLRVRHVRHLRQHGRDIRHAGCEFVQLPAATQTKLFRYLMQLDREQLARQRERGATAP